MGPEHTTRTYMHWRCMTSTYGLYSCHFFGVSLDYQGSTTPQLLWLSCGGLLIWNPRSCSSSWRSALSWRCRLPGALNKRRLLPRLPGSCPTESVGGLSNGLFKQCVSATPSAVTNPYTKLSQYKLIWIVVITFDYFLVTSWLLFDYFLNSFDYCCKFSKLTSDVCQIFMWSLLDYSWCLLVS